MANILDPSALLTSLPGFLPETKSLTYPQDALAALTHSILSILAFRLVGVDDSSSVGAFVDNVLPDKWNIHAPGTYTFRYRHDQSSLEFLVKVLKLGPRTLINAIAIETDKTASLDISTNDFVSPSFFPHVVGAAGSPPLVHGFISSNRVADFVTQFNLKITQKLIPQLRKEGYTEDTGDASTNSTSNPRFGQPSNQNQRPPVRPENSRPSPDEPRVPPGLTSHIPPENPLQIGRRDLDPIAIQGRPNPFAPPPLFPSTQGDGMFVGPDHPIFGGAFGPRRDLGSPGSRGPWGGDGFLPPMGAPPGSRFDPVGPGPFGPGGNVFGVPRGMGGRGPRNPNGEPDNDEFMPPGSGDMFS
ncbi:hypothetical protein M0805_003710 [Coniferiporia weirii]|nr:hypothetical protein M0805_003710 [Coniferiporia weirii]